MTKTNFVHSRAAIALISLLIVASVIMILASSSIILGVNEIELTIADQTSTNTKVWLGACLEETALRMKQNPSWTGGSLNIENITCNINLSTQGNIHTANITLTVDNFTHAAQATFEVLQNGQVNNISLDAWRTR